MSVLDVQDLRKSFGARTLLEGVAFTLAEGEKVGLIGVNGSGKSTLLRIVAGEEGMDEGSVARRRGARVGYLAQEPDFAADETIRSAVAAGSPALHDALAEYHALALRLTAGEDPDVRERLLARQGQLAARIDALGGWEWEHRVEAMLTRLGIDRFDRPVAELSGGERKRVALARVLLDRPELLLLDEPTNHLDADTTLWLEQHLLEYAGAVLLVTHDRYLLDRVVTRMLEVAAGRVAAFPGGYTQYLERQAERLERQTVEERKRARLIEQELAWVRRSPSARTGKQQARINRLDALQAEQQSRNRTPEAADMRFGDPPRLGRTVLDLHQLSKSFGHQVLIRDLTTGLRAGERVGIIGPNGAGKTTLLRIILGEEPADAGEVRLGENTRLAYFDQRREDLDPEATIYEAAADQDWVALGGERVHLRSYLERFLFHPRVQQQKVGSLSGGERSRLRLARLFLQQANLLILDEPTNDLDLVTLQVLESVLAEFPGCVLMVTHDRFFLDKVATRLLVFEGDAVVHQHEGGYELYRRLREHREAAREAGQKRSPAAAPAAPAPRRERITGARKLTYREQQELDGAEERIVAAESAKDELAARLGDPALYADTPEAVARLGAAYQAAVAEVEALYDRWAELEALRGGSGSAGRE